MKLGILLIAFKIILFNFHVSVCLALSRVNETEDALEFEVFTFNIAMIVIRICVSFADMERLEHKWSQFN